MEDEEDSDDGDGHISVGDQTSYHGIKKAKANRCICEIVVWMFTHDVRGLYFEHEKLKMSDEVSRISNRREKKELLLITPNREQFKPNQALLIRDNCSVPNLII